MGATNRPRWLWGALLLPGILLLVLFPSACVPSRSVLPKDGVAGPVGPPGTLTYPRSTERAIKMGFIAPLTGAMAGYGAAQRVAVQLALEDIVKAGGINGHPLLVVMVDSAADPREEALLMRRLTAEDQAVAVIGLLTSAGLEGVAPLAGEPQIPLVAAGLDDPAASDRRLPGVFRLGPSDTVATAQVIASYKTLSPSLKRVVIVGYSGEPASQRRARDTYPKALREAGLEVVDTVYLEAGQSGLSATVAKVRGINPQGLALAAPAPEAVALARELQRQRLRMPVLASLQNWEGPEISLAGDAMEGWVAVGTFDEGSPEPLARAYVERFGRAGEGDPALGKPLRPGPAAPAYDAVLALAQVVGQGQVTPEMDIGKVRRAILAGLQGLKGFRGIAGALSTGANGEMAAPPLSFVAKGGKWVLVR